MLKSTVLLSFTLFLSNFLKAQSIEPFQINEYKYLLIVIYENENGNKNAMCRDDEILVEKYLDKATLENRKKEIRKEFKGLPIILVVYPNQAVIVYEYRKEEIPWSCSKRLYTYWIGTNLSECRESMEKDVLKRPKHYFTKPVVNLERAPIVEPRTTAIFQNWDGIEVTYKFGKAGSPDEFAVIQFKNTLKNKAANVAVFNKKTYNTLAQLSKPLEEILLEPGWNGTFKLNNPDDYILIQKWEEPGNKKSNRGTIDWLKGNIRSQVTKDYQALTPTQKDSINKLQNIRGTTWGVRG